MNSSMLHYEMGRMGVGRRLVAGALGLALAVVMGASIPNGNYGTLILIGAFGCLVFYLAYLQKFTWQIALLISYTGFFYRPLGFDVGSTELTCGLGFLLILVNGWQKKPVVTTGLLQSGSFKLLQLLLLLWLIYVGGHIWFNIHDPFRPGDFALKNVLKSYFASSAPAVLLWYFAKNPQAIRVKRNVLQTLTLLLLVGVLANLLITAYGLAQHHNIADPDATDLYIPTFFLPGLNMRENPFVLRGLGPAAVLFATTCLSLGKPTTGVSRPLSLTLLFVGSIGTLLSSGRASVSTAIVLVLTTLLLTKRFRVLITVMALAATFILLINVFSTWVDRNAPIPVLRPLQWIMITKNAESNASIESSSLWREELFDMAIKEWRSSPRIFWFGRATYGFGVGDYVAMQVSGGWTAGLESSLRRGATHNLLGDLLVTYGLIGCIIYYFVILAIIRFLWRVYKSQAVDPAIHSLALICLITYVSYLLIASVAGGMYLPETVWLLIVLIAALCRPNFQSAVEKEPRTAPERAATRLSFRQNR